MRDTLGESLKKLTWIRIRRSRLSAVLLVLSLVVSLNVFWALRQPGVTMAGDAACGILEHTHDDACMTQVCICDLTKEPHIHSESCYTTQVTPAQENWQLVCTTTEDPHIHNDSCYIVQVTPAQEISQLVCGQTDEFHIHEDTCYETIMTAPVEEFILNCGLQFEPHEHTESCYMLEVTEAFEEQILICDLIEDEHVHGDACYTMELSCEQQEHVHSIDCYSDETADVETLLDWQNMFAGYPYTGDLRQDLVGIANTQVGYSESTRNFEVDSDGIRHGYTRYGAWYGTPYRDWSAAFVSFCLNYAGADSAQTPGNIGANAMAELWNNLGRFSSIGEYIPASGDLVFFIDNTVGIVTEVQSATFYVIRGDVDNAVRTDAISLNDASIAGWGITGDFSEEISQEETEESFQEPAEEISGEVTEKVSAELTWEEMLDISNGPVFYIFIGDEVPPQMQTYSLRNSRIVTDLKSYLDGVEGTITFVLLNTDDTDVPKDENGNFVVESDIGYKLHIKINSPNGIHPGTYQYQLPDGVIVDNGEGTLVRNEIELGSWKVTKNGLITLEFNENMLTQSGISIPATMGVQFSEDAGLIDFDGQIKVIVNAPPGEEYRTGLNKWGKQGNEEDTQGKTDPSKIYWTIEIKGNQDSQIPGNVLTDKIVSGEWYGTHRYTESDMAAGLKFGATDPNGEWHSWKVNQGDPMLEWTENGWSYKIPETVICQNCGSLELGNDDWIYYVDYTTTPDATNHVGGLTYANEATVDERFSWGYVQFNHGEARGEIHKSGSFQADASGGLFRWEITAVISGIQEGQIADFWYIMDNMDLRDSNGNVIGLITNDIDTASVTATYHGTTIQVPKLEDATKADPFAWFVFSWGSENNGVYYGRNIGILCNCTCTEKNCPWWGDAGCGSKPWIGGKQHEIFCQCWTADTTTFTFTYETKDISIIEKYGGVGNQLYNRAELSYKLVKDETLYSIGNGMDAVTIPGLFKKELTQDFNGYTAHYNITVNEAKLSLTDGSPLYIHDEMTETLAYISGSLVITSEDANGNTDVLQQDVDYTVTYDGTGKETDKNGKPVHTLDIAILHPQPVKYILDYDATLIIPEQTAAGVKYGNSASITLWGQTITDESQEKTYTEFGITGESYKVQLHKKCSLTGDSLSNATFGLFHAQGGQITTGVTDESGQITFQTNIVKGIIFREHMLYYMQELQAPSGYQLDDTKYWFCFCNNPADTCETCTTIMEGKEGLRIPYGKIETIYVANEIMNYDLPATGGFGMFPLILVSVMFIIIPLVYMSVQRCKRERRDVT